MRRVSVFRTQAFAMGAMSQVAEVAVSRKFVVARLNDLCGVVRVWLGFDFADLLSYFFAEQSIVRLVRMKVPLWPVVLWSGKIFYLINCLERLPLSFMDKREAKVFVGGFCPSGDAERMRLSEQELVDALSWTNVGILAQEF